MKSLINTIRLLLLKPKPPKVFCMFDNMQKDNRLVINALCEFDPLEEWGTWRNNQLHFPLFLKKLVKYKPDATKAMSYARFALINYGGRNLQIDLQDGTIIRPLRNIKFFEGERKINGFSIFSHHSTAANSAVFNRRIEITIPSIGKVVLTTQNRGINAEFKQQFQKNLSEANSRGALVSEICAQEIPRLSTILPLQKTPKEIDFANGVLEKKWRDDIEVFEQWQKRNPERNTPEQWKSEKDSQGNRKQLPPREPRKIDW